ncbi:MAG: hypothetical protein RCG15_06610 [Candidatus Rickettsia vulgarisii]
MAENYIDSTEFDVGGAKSTGGVTGSKRVQRNGANYQLKPSIQDAKFIRRTKAGGTDRENFGELIAATISKNIVEQNQDVELVPEVSLVYDKDHKKVLVASKYLQNVQGTLDDFAKKDRGIEVSGRHVKVSAELEVGDNLNLGNTNDKTLRKDLAQGIAVSALCGDHDVNPGNMLVVKDQQGNNRVARIDFGHAFNDLLNAPEMFGGGVRNQHNIVLDFLNRQEVASFPSAGETKLWKNYQGIVPSQELIDAFNKLGKSDGLKQGLENAKKPFEELIKDLSQDPKANKDVLDHIKNSLIAINNNISNKNKQISADTTIEETLNKTFENIGDFYKENQKQMLDVAKLMDMQLKIDKVITAKKNHKEIDQSLITEIHDTYNKLLNVQGIGDGRNLEWVKSSKNIAGFKENLGEFIKSRALNLGVAVEGEVTDLNDFANKKEIENPVINEITKESKFVADFLEQSVQCYIKNKNKQDCGLITVEDVKEKTKDSLTFWLDTNGKERVQNSNENIQEITKHLKENLDDYVNVMDKKLTEARDKSLKEQGVKPNKADPKELIEAMQKVSTDNIYTKMSKDVVNKGHLLGSEGDTIWKSLSSFCSSIGLKKLGKFFEHKNEQARAHIIAKAIGITTHAAEKVVKGIRKGSESFVNKTNGHSSHGHNRNKNDTHTH